MPQRERELGDYQATMRGLFPALLGMRLISVAPELVVGELDVRHELCTAPGVMHGGAIMAFADTLGAVATMANLDDESGTTTIESKTNFFRPGPEGSTVRGETRPLHRGAHARRSGRPRSRTPTAGSWHRSRRRRWCCPRSSAAFAGAAQALVYSGEIDPSRCDLAARQESAMSGRRWPTSWAS